jgi:hypothetical protein
MRVAGASTHNVADTASIKLSSNPRLSPVPSMATSLRLPPNAMLAIVSATAAEADCVNKPTTIKSPASSPNVMT